MGFIQSRPGFKTWWGAVQDPTQAQGQELNSHRGRYDPPNWQRATSRAPVREREQGVPSPLCFVYYSIPLRFLNLGKEDSRGRGLAHCQRKGCHLAGLRCREVLGHPWQDASSFFSRVLPLNLCAPISPLMSCSTEHQSRARFLHPFEKWAPFIPCSTVCC